jgi:hypothetical protein
MSEAVSHAKSAGWVHLAVSEQKGQQAMTLTQDSGPTAGEQTITGRGIVAKVILIGTAAYIQGNAQAITGYFGFPPSAVATLANRWIAIPPTNPAFPAVSVGVTLSSALSESALSGPLAETPKTTRLGRAVLGVRGIPSGPDSGGGTGALYVSDDNKALPVEYDASPTGGGSLRVIFTNWGSAVRISAPPGAIPAAGIGQNV